MTDQTANIDLTSSAVDSVVFGQPVTFTATLSTDAGLPAPTGTVQFLDGTVVLATFPLTDGAASFTTSNLATGPHALTVVYSGDGVFATATSDSSTTVDVVPATTSATVSASESTPVFGQAVTYTATVSAPVGTIGGTVQFKVDGNAVGLPVPLNAEGQANLSLRLNAGSHKIDAHYGGSTNLEATSGSLTQSIEQAATNIDVTLFSSDVLSVDGPQIIINAAISTSSLGAGTPGGTVSFIVGNTVLDTQVLSTSGTAVSNPITLPAGASGITVLYSGESNFAVSSTDIIANRVTEETPPFNLDINNLQVDNVELIGDDIRGITISSNRLTVDPTAFNDLAVGESSAIIARYTLNGSTSTQTAVIVITGVNDIPTPGGAITSTAGEDDEAYSVDLLTGASDADDSDILGIADLVAIIDDDSDDDRGISISGHRLVVVPGGYDDLAVGEKAKVVYQYNVVDGQGGSVPQSATITITGVNDAPQVTAAVKSKIIPTDPAYTLDLLDWAGDPDTSDTLNVANLTSTGDTDGVSVVDNTLEIDPWAYRYLGRGEVGVITYSYDVIDGNGGSAPQSATITIIGVNDAPDITVDAEAGDSDEQTLYETDAKLTGLGTLSVEDVNLTDTVDARVLSVDVSGNNAEISDETLLEMMSVNADHVIDSETTVGTINWSFDSGVEAFDYLSDGEYLELVYTIEAKDTSDAIDTQTVTVRILGTNDKPVITELNSSNPTLETRGVIGVPVQVDGTFFDIDTSDLHTVTIDWGEAAGDSDSETFSVSELAQTQTGSFWQEHTYKTGGIFTITVTVNDGLDDGILTTTAVIGGVGRVDDTLYIIGTEGRDHIDVKLKSKDDVIEIDAKLNQDDADPDMERERVKETYPAASIKHIVAHLLDGDDKVKIDKDILAEAILDGGDGKDHLKAGGGNTTLLGGRGDDNLDGGDGDDVLVGGDDNDKLDGGKGDDDLNGGSGKDDLKGSDGNDVLVGGDGDDKLDGGKGQNLLIGGLGKDDIKGDASSAKDAGGDILIGGWTSHDNDRATLRSILDNAWVSRFAAGDDYDDIVDDLVNDSFSPGTSVFDDGVKDKLHGSNKAHDLFFADIDKNDADDDDLKGDKGDRIIDLNEALSP